MQYLIEASYTPEGVKGLRKDGGTTRQEAIDEMVRGLGGGLDAFWFAFGDRDVFAIVDMPDAESMAAVALAINADGRTHVRTTPLLSPAEIDGAVKRNVTYRGPGS